MNGMQCSQDAKGPSMSATFADPAHARRFAALCASRVPSAKLSLDGQTVRVRHDDGDSAQLFALAGRVRRMSDAAAVRQHRIAMEKGPKVLNGTPTNGVITQISETPPAPGTPPPTSLAEKQMTPTDQLPAVRKATQDPPKPQTPPPPRRQVLEVHFLRQDTAREAYDRLRRAGVECRWDGEERVRCAVTPDTRGVINDVVAAYKGSPVSPPRKAVRKAVAAAFESKVKPWHRPGHPQYTPPPAGSPAQTQGEPAEKQWPRTPLDDRADQVLLVLAGAATASVILGALHQLGVAAYQSGRNVVARLTRQGDQAKVDVVAGKPGVVAVKKSRSGKRRPKAQGTTQQAASLSGVACEETPTQAIVRLVVDFASPWLADQFAKLAGRAGWDVHKSSKWSLTMSITSLLKAAAHKAIEKYHGRIESERTVPAAEATPEEKKALKIPPATKVMNKKKFVKQVQLKPDDEATSRRRLGAASFGMLNSPADAAYVDCWFTDKGTADSFERWVSTVHGLEAQRQSAAWLRVYCPLEARNRRLQHVAALAKAHGAKRVRTSASGMRNSAALANDGTVDPAVSAALRRLHGWLRPDGAFVATVGGELHGETLARVSEGKGFVQRPGSVGEESGKPGCDERLNAILAGWARLGYEGNRPVGGRWRVSADCLASRAGAVAAFLRRNLPPAPVTVEFNFVSPQGRYGARRDVELSHGAAAEDVACVAPVAIGWAVYYTAATIANLAMGVELVKTIRQALGPKARVIKARGKTVVIKSKDRATQAQVDALVRSKGGQARDVRPSEASFSSYPWDECVRDAKRRYGSDEAARRVCGKIRSQRGASQDASFALTPLSNRRAGYSSLKGTFDFENERQADRFLQHARQLRANPSKFIKDGIWFVEAMYKDEETGHELTRAAMQLGGAPYTTKVSSASFALTPFRGGAHSGSFCFASKAVADRFVDHAKQLGVSGQLKTDSQAVPGKPFEVWVVLKDKETAEELAKLEQRLNHYVKTSFSVEASDVAQQIIEFAISPFVIASAMLYLQRKGIRCYKKNGDKTLVCRVSEAGGNAVKSLVQTMDQKFDAVVSKVPGIKFKPAEDWGPTKTETKVLKTARGAIKRGEGAVEAVKRGIDFVTPHGQKEWALATVVTLGTAAAAYGLYKALIAAGVACKQVGKGVLVALRGHGDQLKLKEAERPVQQEIISEQPGRVPASFAMSMAEPVRVPMMITRDMKQQLLDLGFKKSDITLMKPQQAWDILTKRGKALPSKPPLRDYVEGRTSLTKKPTSPPPKPTGVGRVDYVGKGGGPKSLKPLGEELVLLFARDAASRAAAAALVAAGVAATAYGTYLVVKYVVPAAWGKVKAIAGRFGGRPATPAEEEAAAEKVGAAMAMAADDSQQRPKWKGGHARRVMQMVGTGDYEHVRTFKKPELGQTHSHLKGLNKSVDVTHVTNDADDKNWTVRGFTTAPRVSKHDKTASMGITSPITSPVDSAETVVGVAAIGGALLFALAPVAARRAVGQLIQTGVAATREGAGTVRAWLRPENLEQAKRAVQTLKASGGRVVRRVRGAEGLPNVWRPS